MNFRVFFATFALLAAFTLAACGGEANDAKMNMRNYGDDGYMGISNSNPNLPLSPGYHTYTKDIVLMKKTLAGIAGISHATIGINGPDVFVRITPKRNLSQRQVNRLLRSAQRQLAAMMPRYRVHVAGTVGK